MKIKYYDEFLDFLNSSLVPDKSEIEPVCQELIKELGMLHGAILNFVTKLEFQHTKPEPENGAYKKFEHGKIWIFSRFTRLVMKFKLPLHRRFCYIALDYDEAYAFQILINMYNKTYSQVALMKKLMGEEWHPEEPYEVVSLRKVPKMWDEVNRKRFY